MSSEKPQPKRLRIVPDAATEPPERIDSGDADCPFCFGTGMEVVPGVGARRCRCQTLDQRELLLTKALIPERFRESTVANFDAEESESKWIAKTEAQIVIDEYLTLNGRGLLFTGNVGVGKTHLAIGILRELIERYHVRGMFFTFGALLKEIQGTYNPVSQSSEVELLRPIFDADVLVLDELASTWPTAWVLDTLMYIINSRYNDKRVTIFTSNFRDISKLESRRHKLRTQLRRLQDMVSETHPDIEAIEREIRSLERGSLEDRIGTRLRSRLFEMCKTVEIEGDDYRKTRAKATRSGK